MYRRIMVGNTDTPGEFETFDVRIGARGLAEWLADREDLQANPEKDRPPDRPPDVDVGNLRAWLMHPGEEDLPYFQTNPTPPPIESLDVFPVCSFAWDTAIGGVWARAMVSGASTGEFEVRVEFGAHEQTPHMVARQYPKEMDPDAVWDDIERQVIGLSERFPESDEGRISTYEDYLLFDADIRAAGTDLMRGFINPLPEGPVH